MKKFTIIEMLIVIAIIAILLSILLPSLTKARKQAYLSVCMSNLSQISKANVHFLKDNKSQFIDQIDLTNRRSGLNVGYTYAGLGGSYNPDVVRPLNHYLGAKVSGPGKMEVAHCPLSKSSDDSVKHFGSSYMAAARVEHTNDLDGTTNDDDSPFLAQIYTPAKMVLLANQGAWHWSKFHQANTSWSADTHGERNYPIAFVDCHVSLVKITEQNTGLTHSFDKLSFVNQEP